MAEFRNIDAFTTTVPTWDQANDMYLQVSNTQKVSLRSIASLAINALLSQWGNVQKASFPIGSSHSIAAAIKGLAYISSNLPWRVVKDPNRYGIALCMGNFGIYIYRDSEDVSDVWIKIRNFPNNNWITDTDAAICEYLNNTSEAQFYLPQYKLREPSGSAITALRSGDVTYMDSSSPLTSIKIDSAYWSPNLNCAMIYAPICRCPKANIQLMNNTQSGINFMKDFNDITSDGTNVCIMVQYLGRSSHAPQFLINACSYNNQ